MVYAVSDTSTQGAPNRGAGGVARAKARRASGSIAIHWPRVIALGLNTLVWVAIIVVVARVRPH